MNTGEERHVHGSWGWRLLGAFLCIAFVVQFLKAQQRKQTYELGLPFVGPVTLVYPGSPDSRNSSTAVVIPPGMILPVRLNLTISSTRCKPGQVITGRIMQYVPLSSGVGIREGSKIRGQIVEVTRATNTAQGRVSFRFDKLVSSHQTISLTTDLRAIAGFMRIMEAQIPPIGAGEGDVYSWLTTVQVGGDIVYGEGGPVTTAENANQVVGKGVAGGVLSKVRPKEGAKCRGAVDGNDAPQALWVFSSDACGTYGLEHISIVHAGRTAPIGLVVLASDEGDFKIPSGAGLLLRVIGGER